MDCHCLFQGDLLDPGIKPRSPALQADSLPAEPPGKPPTLFSSMPFYLSVDSRNHRHGQDSEQLYQCCPPRPGTATSRRPLLSNSWQRCSISGQWTIIDSPCASRHAKPGRILTQIINEINRKARWLRVQAGTRLTGFSSWVCRLQALWPLAKHISSLSQFLRDEMGLVTEPSGVVEIQGADTCRGGRKRLVWTDVY